MDSLVFAVAVAVAVISWFGFRHVLPLFFKSGKVAVSLKAHACGKSL
jgi:hypothetical protein